MKRLYIVALALFVAGCSDNNLENTDLTGESVSQHLFSGSDFGYEGEIIFQEKTDGSTRIVINLDGPKEETLFPTHLHFGPFDAPDAEIAAMLNPVSGSSGQSITEFDILANGSTMAYSDLVSFDGHIKVHLDDGANYDVILVFGNVGANREKLDGEAADCENDLN